MITLKQLRYLQALAVSGHFGRAAEAVGVTQPALSMQVRDLERSLGGKLVERTGAGARLTPFGHEVVARGRDILAAVDDLENIAHAHGEPLEGPVRLGVIPSIAPFLLPRLLALAGERHPRLKLVVRETVTRVLVDELVGGALDAIVASLPLGHGELAEVPAFDDRFLLAAPEDSAHAARSPALTELISADELLLLEDGHCLRDQALEVCHAIDPRRLRSFGATSLATLLQLVAAGHGITLIPQLAVSAGLPLAGTVRVVRFADPEPRRTIAVAWRKRSPRERDYAALTALVRDAGSTATGQHP